MLILRAEQKKAIGRAEEVDVFEDGSCNIFDLSLDCGSLEVVYLIAEACLLQISKGVLHKGKVYFRNALDFYCEDAISAGEQAMFIITDMIKVMRKQSNKPILLFFCNGLNHNSMVCAEKEETSTCTK